MERPQPGLLIKGSGKFRLLGSVMHAAEVKIFKVVASSMKMARVLDSVLFRFIFLLSHRNHLRTQNLQTQHAEEVISEKHSFALVYLFP